MWVALWIDTLRRLLLTAWAPIGSPGALLPFLLLAGLSLSTARLRLLLARIRLLTRSATPSTATAAAAPLALTILTLGLISGLSLLLLLLFLPSAFLAALASGTTPAASTAVLPTRLLL